MKSKLTTAALFSIALVAGTSSIFAQDKMMMKNNMKEKTVMVGGTEMYPTKNIVENAVNSKEHTTLVALVKAADLVETIQGDGPLRFLHQPMPLLKNFQKELLKWY